MCTSAGLNTINKALQTFYLALREAIDVWISQAMSPYVRDCDIAVASSANTDLRVVVRSVSVLKRTRSTYLSVVVKTNTGGVAVINDLGYLCSIHFHDEAIPGLADMPDSIFPLVDVHLNTFR